MTSDWLANLRALAQNTAPSARDLVLRLTEGGPGPDLGLRNRGGKPIPGVVVGGRVRALVSAYDEPKEAERWAQDVGGGTVAVFGGGGQEAFSALARHGVRLAFWVEPRLEVWQSLLTWQDWTPWLADARWVPVGPGVAWEQTLRNRYHPLWDGAFQTLEWRGAIEGTERLWDDTRAATLLALDSITSDASTQARFGERWYRNTLTNLKRLSRGAVSGCEGARVVVAGAGPSLEDALEDVDHRTWLAQRSQTGDRLFATDTALPALTARGIVPDLVLCLDGQLPSYHHFVPPRPAVPLVADLASIPLLGRLGMPMVRYLSGHPFTRVIHRVFPEIPVLDGSLGNVSGLGLTLARAMGARSVEAWGVGFSYRNGQAYARGTYVYELAGRKADRLGPWESRLGAACYGASGLRRTFDEAGRALDTTPLLRDYQRRWDAAPPSVHRVDLSHGDAQARWPGFVEHWRNRLVTLPLPLRGAPVHSFVLGLEKDQRIDWWALWPLALSLHRQGVGEGDLPVAVVERALSFLED